MSRTLFDQPIGRVLEEDEEPRVLWLRARISRELSDSSRSPSGTQYGQGRHVRVIARPYFRETEIEEAERSAPGVSLGRAAAGSVPSPHTRTRRIWMGWAEATIYPEGMALIHSEYLPDFADVDDPTSDDVLAVIWHGLEAFLSTHFYVRRFVVPSTEPIYPAHIWREFLRNQGYRPLSHSTYQKKATRSEHVAARPPGFRDLEPNTLREPPLVSQSQGEANPDKRRT